jgi:thiol:disulfide interchange protein
MKPLFSLLCLAFALQAATPTVKWMDFGKALAVSKKDSLFVLVEVYADWCVPCKMMDATTFRDTSVTRILNRYFLPTRLNADSTNLIECNNWPRPTANCIQENWNLTGVPSFVLIGPSGNYLTSITNTLDADQMTQILTHFMDNRNLLLESDRNPKEETDVP